MKKVLFASTALVASAGIAAADGHSGVSLSGSAEIGIIGGDAIEDQFHTDVDVTFTLSGTTDNGLTFGGSIDLDESVTGTAFNNRTQGGESLFVSGEFGTLTMGDTDGALDWAMTEAIIGGAINDDHEHAGYNGNSFLDGSTNGNSAPDGAGNIVDDGLGDGQIARYDYSFGDFAVAVSAEIDTGVDGDGGNAESGNVYAIGLKYSSTFGGVDLGFGLGYQTNDDSDAMGVSIDANFSGGLRAILNFSNVDNGAGADIDHVGLAVGYTFDAITVAVNYGQFDNGAADVDGFGLVVNYDLGGGAALQFGYGSSDAGAGASVDQYSFGLSMSF